MDIYTTTPKAIEGDILTASAAYTVAPDISDSPVTFALNSNGAIVFRHNADDTVVTEGLLAECAEDEALIAAAWAFVGELADDGRDDDSEWLADEALKADAEAGATVKNL